MWIGRCVCKDWDPITETGICADSERGLDMVHAAGKVYSESVWRLPCAFLGQDWGPVCDVDGMSGRKSLELYQ